MLRKAPSVTTPATVTDSHHLGPRMAAIIGNRIIAKGISVRRGEPG
jgi:hypothetical protein